MTPNVVPPSAALSILRYAQHRELPLWLCNKVLKYLAVMVEQAGDSGDVKEGRLVYTQTGHPFRVFTYRHSQLRSTGFHRSCLQRLDSQCRQFQRVLTRILHSECHLKE